MARARKNPAEIESALLSLVSEACCCVTEAELVKTGQFGALVEYAGTF